MLEAKWHSTKRKGIYAAVLHKSQHNAICQGYFLSTFWSLIFPWKAITNFLHTHAHTQILEGLTYIEPHFFSKFLTRIFFRFLYSNNCIYFFKKDRNNILAKVVNFLNNIKNQILFRVATIGQWVCSKFSGNQIPFITN